MTHTAHTPGEWATRLEPEWNGGPEIMVVAHQGNFDVVVAIVSSFTTPPSDEAIANARLIAAAPDMLALLQEAARDMAAHYDYYGIYHLMGANTDEDCGRCQWVLSARSVLAAIQGEQG